MAKARLVGEGAHDSVRDGAATEGNGRAERRRDGRSDDSPADILTRLPAVVALERIPVPALAMAQDGIIVFANTAFAEMVGYGQDRLTGMALPEIFHTTPAALWAPAGVHPLPNLVVELQHCEGWMVRAKMSKSALMRSDDPVVLVTFENLTEQLWMDD